MPRTPPVSRATLAVTAAFLLAPYAASAVAYDSDGDGVVDGADALPCDPTASALAFAPGEGTYGMMMFEDRWPGRGDLDFNDVVLAHHVTLRLDAAGRVRGLRARYEALAIGGIIRNGLGLHLPVPRGAASTITRTLDGVSVPLTASSADAELTVILTNDLRELFTGSHEQINSRADLPRQTGRVLEVDVTFSSPVTLPIADAPFDLYLVQSDRPGHQIHRPHYAGTANMDVGLFGLQDDGSTPGHSFVDTDGLPFALVLPVLTHYPREGTEIAQLFPTITQFAASGGASARDFYQVQVGAAAAFRDSAGASAYAPAPALVDYVGSCGVDADGDGERSSTDCDDSRASVHHGATEVCNGIDDDCDGAIDEGTGAMQSFHRDHDNDGFGDGVIVQACSAPPGYVLYTPARCSNGSYTDCNVNGTTLIASSAYRHTAPPVGWVQCAGFTNTNGDDVAHNFFDNCLGASDLRLQVRTTAGVVEEDITVTGMPVISSWPNWNYLGGSMTPNVRTRWGQTTFFTTTDGRDACTQASASTGNTFGTGNGSVGIIAGGNTNANEYRVSCGGAALADRQVAIFRAGTQVGAVQLDCNDDDGNRSPGRVEQCNNVDDDCDGVADEGNPGGGGTCSTGLQGACSVGTLMCTNGGLQCAATTQPITEVCGNAVDDDCDGLVDEGACARACSNGSFTDCNVAGSTVIASSAYVDGNPPAGWTQCAGFTNTGGNDVNHNFFDNCLNSTRLRLRVTTTAGVVEEDITVTGMSAWAAWPNWNYLGGSVSATTRTRWGTTTFFTTTTGRDACNQVSASAGGNTFGTGNGSVGIVAGGNTGSDEYRVSCGGAALPDRRIAIYR